MLYLYSIKQRTTNIKTACVYRQGLFSDKNQVRSVIGRHIRF